MIQFCCFFIDFMLCTMVECDDVRGECQVQRLHYVAIASCSGHKLYFPARFHWKLIWHTFGYSGYPNGPIQCPPGAFFT